ITAFFFAEPLVHLFRDDLKVMEIGAVAMRYQCLSLLFLPFSVCNNMMFQSTGKSLQASILSSFRSGLFFIPVILIFPQIWGLFGIQISQAVADVLASVFSIPFTISYFKNLPQDENS
ncbi:MAG: MATE family efflux transporter, partial [Lachnospiraceae bacterium]|nr:MATE family efflux transporter [Lachnospiraceae bacterium]